MSYIKKHSPKSLVLLISSNKSSPETQNVPGRLWSGRRQTHALVTITRDSHGDDGHRAHLLSHLVQPFIFLRMSWPHDARIQPPNHLKSLPNAASIGLHPIPEQARSKLELKCQVQEREPSSQNPKKSCKKDAPPRTLQIRPFHDHSGHVHRKWTAKQATEVSVFWALTFAPIRTFVRSICRKHCHFS